MSLQIALQFLTRIPVSLPHAPTAQELGQSVLYYPLVGFIIGGLLVGVSVLFNPLSLAVHAALLLSFWVLLTGGLHLDGLADCADAWAGGLKNTARSLAIMKDPHLGSLAVVLLILTLLLKWGGLQTLLIQANWQGLIITPILGRCAILVLIQTTPYISPHGLGAVLTQNVSARGLKTVIGIVLLMSSLTIGLIPVCCAGLMLYAVRYLALQRLHGVTGDVYGASVELVEVAVLLGLGYV